MEAAGTKLSALRDGTEPAVKFYTHVTGQFAPYATNAIHLCRRYPSGRLDESMTNVRLSRFC